MNISFRMLRRIPLLVCFIILLSIPVLAHPTPYSYLDLKIEGTQIEVTLVAHVFDLAHDLNVSNIETLFDGSVIEAKRVEIENLIKSRVFVTVDGSSRAIEFSSLEPLPDRQAVAAHFRYSLASVPGRVNLECVMFPYDPQHQTFVNIYEKG